MSSLMSERILKPTILILMTLIAIYTYRKKDLGHEEKHRFELSKIPLYGLLIGIKNIVGYIYFIVMTSANRHIFSVTVTK